jgi:hypothetical protein
MVSSCSRYDSLAGFQPGFRLSFIDVVVLVIGATASAALWNAVWWIGFIVAFVVAHFFLFCNVFRIARPLELAWAGVFIALVYGTIAFSVPGWPAAIAGSLAVTVAVIALEMRKLSYHGVLWQRINPALPEWWSANPNSGLRAP